LAQAIGASWAPPLRSGCGAAAAARCVRATSAAASASPAVAMDDATSVSGLLSPRPQEVDEAGGEGPAFSGSFSRGLGAHARGRRRLEPHEWPGVGRGHLTCGCRSTSLLALGVAAFLAAAATMRGDSAATRDMMVADESDVVGLSAHHKESEGSHHRRRKTHHPYYLAHAKEGWKVYVKSHTGHKRACTVLHVMTKHVKIHYDTFPDAFDEWIPKHSSRILGLVPTTTSTSTSTTRTVTSTTTFTETTTSTSTSTQTTTTSSSTTTPRQYVSLFCFTLARSDNDELAIMRMQLEKRIGVYDCDEQIVFSDEVTWLSEGPTYLRGHSNKILIETHKVGVNFSDALTGSEADARTAAWLNAADYVKCWKEVIMDGRFRWHDWVVKVDPDTVFLPARLRAQLMHKPDHASDAVYLRTCKSTPRKCLNTVTLSRSYGADWSIQVVGSSDDTYIVESVCDTSSEHGQNCEKEGWGKGVHNVKNQNSKVVGEGNCCNEKNAVKSVTNECPQKQSESKDPGLSGALEVMSKAAVEKFGQQYQQCLVDGYGSTGEEFFLQECLELLGVGHMPGEHLLSDEFCGSYAEECRGTQVAFHPFKTLESYLLCMGHAFEELSVPELHADLLQVSHADG